MVPVYRVQDKAKTIP